MSTRRKKGDLLIDNNTGVHCNSKKLAKRVLKVAHELGYKWRDETSFLKKTHHKEYGFETVYILAEGMYEDREWAAINERQIISAKKFLELHGKWEETKPTETPADQIDLTKLPIGTKVWSLIRGEGVVTDVYTEDNHISVWFESFSKTAPFNNGQVDYYGTHPTLAPSKEAFLANPLNPWGTYDFSQHEPIKEEETEESPYNKDGSIKKGWLCEFWDDSDTHARNIKFFTGVGENETYFGCRFDGELSNYKWDNCRPIPRSEWPDWAVEAHKTLKI